jgi:DNA-binding NtrC family response regulator
MNAPVAALRVLLVDDDAGVRDTIGRFLSRRGHVVRTGANGEQAEQALCAEGVDVVILDLRLGGEDGVELGRRLHERHPELLIIALTAYAVEEKAEELAQHGFFDWIAKPLEPDTLLKVLSRAASHLQQQPSPPRR